MEPTGEGPRRGEEVPHDHGVAVEGDALNAGVAVGGDDVVLHVLKSTTIRRIRQQIWGRIFVNFIAYLCTFSSFSTGFVGKGHIKEIAIQSCTPLGVGVWP